MSFSFDYLYFILLSSQLSSFINLFPVAINASKNANIELVRNKLFLSIDLLDN